MCHPAETLAGPLRATAPANAAAAVFRRHSIWLLLFAAAGIPLSLLWDFSWESTVGIDLVWSAAHTATYLAAGLAGLTALALVSPNQGGPGSPSSGVRLGRFQAPLGIWLTIWGAVAFGAAVLFDRWW